MKAPRSIGVVGALAVTLALTVALVAGTGVVAVRPVQAQQPPPVRVEIHGLFGNEVLSSGYWQSVVVTLENRTRTVLPGRVAVWQSQYDSAPVHYETRIDLPPRATRTVLTTLYVGDGGELLARYLVGDETFGAASVSPSYSSGARSVVVMSDPARLRGQLLDLDVEQSDVSNRGSGRTVRVPVGTVAFEGRSGDALLPTDAVAWSSVALLAVSGPMLARIAPAERRALIDWLHAGGRMIVFPRTEADLRDPFLRGLVGDVGQFTGVSTVINEQLVPRAMRGRYLRGGRVATEAFGGSARVGFGRIYLATFDGMAPPYVEAPETRELVRAILGTRLQMGNDYPMLPFGATEERIGSNWFGQGVNFGKLRAALDPNESYRPALVIAAVLLLLYIVAVGPLNFSWVLKRNKPTLALISTPIVAFACLAAMLLVGYFGKGVLMRYRRVEVIEALEGSPLGPARRYTGFFLTRPAEFDVDAPARGVARRVLGTGGELPPVIENLGTRTTLHDVRGRLWDTVFLREDRVIELGRGITFRRDGLSLTEVVNNTPYPIRGAVVVDASNNVYRVGDIAPGGHAVVARNYTTTLSSGYEYESASIAEGSVSRISPLLGLQSTDRDAMVGTLALLNGTPVVAPMPVLFAQLQIGETRELAGIFSREQDLVFIRVVPDQPLEPIRPAAAASTTGNVVPPAQPEQTDDGQEPSTQDVDAGAPDGGAP